MALDPFSIALQGVGTVAQLGFGTWQFFNALKQAKQLVRPTYKIDPSYQYNIDLIKSNFGIPSEALNFFRNSSGQQQAAGIEAVNANNGDPNLIASIIGAGRRADEGILAQNSLQFKEDLDKLRLATTSLAEQKDKAFQINEYAPYVDKAGAIAAQKAAGIQNLFGGLNSAAGMGANIATSKIFEDALAKMGGSATSPLTEESIPNYYDMIKQASTTAAAFATTNNSAPYSKNPFQTGQEFNSTMDFLKNRPVGDYRNGFQLYNDWMPQVETGTNNFDSYGMGDFSMYKNLFKQQFNPNFNIFLNSLFGKNYSNLQ